MECDMRIVLPLHIDIYAPEVIKKFEGACDAEKKWTVMGDVERFGRKIPSVRMYSYEEILPDLALEYEVCINNRPYYEIAKVWKQVFTPDEIAHQTEIRGAARNVMHVDYQTDYLAIKKQQCTECRYRLIANYWIQDHYPKLLARGQEHLGFIPIKESRPEFINDLVEQWGRGKNRWAEMMQHPAPLSDRLQSRYRAHGLQYLMDAPEPPLWLTLAESLRR